MSFDTFITAIINWFVAHGIKIILIAAGVFIVQRILKTAIHHLMDRIVRKTYHKRDEAALSKRQDTLESVSYTTTKIVLWIVAGIMIISELGVNIAPLLAGAGIAGLAFGFGGQYLIRDIIAGLFIILEDQFRRGDVIRIAGIAGLVENVNLRRTVLRDLDGIEHHIPNGEITTTSNMTKFWARIHLNIGVSYDTDLDKATKVLNSVCKEFADDPKWKDDIIKTPEVIGVDDFADSAIIIKVLGDTKPMRQWDAMRELRKRIKIVFDKEGIEIPFPHRVIIKK